MSDTARRPGGEQFPCASLGEALPHLRRPPGAAAVRFKIQNAADDAAQIATYIDARLVYDRLDQVCGERWSARFAPLARALVPRGRGDGEPPPLYVRCQLTLYGVIREDVGEGHDPKAALSDAVKRAAVTFGVGRVLYAMRLPWLQAGDADGELRRNGQGDLVLDERTEAWCRAKYERWLEERGSGQFGEPLEHCAAGADEEAGATEAREPTAPAAIRAAAA
jgi:Rad52/22 family double-strand break repair protein